MSKRKGAVADETKSLLLSAAQAIFLESGFKDATLRQICQKAHVTTGALYCFYKDKNALFEELLSPFVEKLFRMITDHFQEEEDSYVKDDAASDDFIARFIDFRDANKAVCDIFLANPEHPYCIEAYEKLVALFTGQTIALLKRVDNVHITNNVFNPDTIRWFSHIQVDMHLQVLRCSFPHEKAAEQMRIYARFLKGGFLELIMPRFPEESTAPSV